MIKQGDCYADNGTAEEMKDQRDNALESKHRSNSIEFNMERFDEMLNHKVEKWEKDDQNVLKNWCIRAKWDMKNKFKCLRDPVFWRVKNEPHHRHGTKYKAYPTYDFACPIVDSLEGVTHAMRSIEYHDRNDGYHHVQKTLGLRKVEIQDFSRVNMVSTVLSKR
jgi:glutamyl/glutaminyl-tRNA synthetase